MGYTTEFRNYFKLSKLATKEQIEYIALFNDTRRMKRDVNKINKLFKGEHGLLGTSIYGIDGEFFAIQDGNCGQSDDGTIIDHNKPPSSQPSLWNHWLITNNGSRLEWDGGEKFYEYIAWLFYMIDNFFNPWDIKLNGYVEYQGEHPEDYGVILIKKNVLSIIKTRNIKKYLRKQKLKNII